MKTRSLGCRRWLSLGLCPPALMCLPAIHSAHGAPAQRASAQGAPAQRTPAGKAKKRSAAAASRSAQPRLTRAALSKTHTAQTQIARAHSARVLPSGGASGFAPALRVSVPQGDIWQLGAMPFRGESSQDRSLASLQSRGWRLSGQRLNGQRFSRLLNADDAGINDGSLRDGGDKSDSANQGKARPRPLRFGVDLYTGRANFKGNRRFSDGMWYGYGTFLPSVVYARWDNGRGSAAKLSLGAGALYNKADDEFYQPAEAWYQLPLGKTNASLTLGKFWVPMGLQEWELESKPGAMLQWSGGPYSVAAAATQNRYTRSGNSYLRLGRSFGERLALGLSLAGGRGLTYNSDHNRGIGLDAALSLGDWKLAAEYLEFRRGGTGRFHFDWFKLSYENGGKLTPYVGRVKWLDELDQQGRFRSLTYGLNYQLTRNFALEGAYGDTADNNRWWGQLHWKQEFD